MYDLCGIIDDDDICPSSCFPFFRVDILTSKRIVEGLHSFYKVLPRSDNNAFSFDWTRG
jgi:hypothetical protein